MLLAWWILAPTPYDDGWVKAREDAYGYLGEFSNYYDHFAASLPLAYWLEWVERAAVSSADGLAIGRIPAVIALAAGWVLCRASARLALGEAAERLALRVVLVVVYLAFAMAWGMTLRPEPFVAALAGASLLGALRFVARPSAGPIAAFAVLVPLGVTIHPIGLVTIAPIVAVAPAILGWARRKTDAWLACGVAAVSAAALALVLFTLDADLAARRASSDAFRSSEGYGLGYRDELSRYDEVLTAYHVDPEHVRARARPGTRPVRDEEPVCADCRLQRAGAVARSRDGPACLHAQQDLVAPWCAHRHRSRRRRRRVSGQPRPFDGPVAVSTRLSRGLRPARGRVVDVAQQRPATQARRAHRGLATADGGLDHAHAGDGRALSAGPRHRRVREMRRRGWLGLRTVGIAAFPYVLVVVVVCVAGFTLDRLAEDALFGKGWTLSRQNVDTLLRRETCGLADDAVSPDRGSFTPLQVASGRRASEPSAAGRPAAAGGWHLPGGCRRHSEHPGTGRRLDARSASRQRVPRPADVVVERARRRGPAFVSSDCPRCGSRVAARWSTGGSERGPPLAVRDAGGSVVATCDRDAGRVRAAANLVPRGSRSRRPLRTTGWHGERAPR